MNSKKVANYFEELEQVGLTKVTIPNYPYRHLNVDDSGRPVDKYGSDGKNHLKFLYLVYLFVHRRC